MALEIGIIFLNRLLFSWTVPNYWPLISRLSRGQRGSPLLDSCLHRQLTDWQRRQPINKGLMCKQLTNRRLPRRHLFGQVPVHIAKSLKIFGPHQMVLHVVFHVHEFMVVWFHYKRDVHNLKCLKNFGQ